MNGHTGGDWRVGSNGDDCAKDHAVCADNRVLAKVYGTGYGARGSGWAPESAADARLMALAPTAPHDCDVPDCPGPRNKRLIEAAGAMLEALRDLVRNVDEDMDGYWTESTSNFMQQAEAALALAEGPN